MGGVGGETNDIVIRQSPFRCHGKNWTPRLSVTQVPRKTTG